MTPKEAILKSGDSRSWEARRERQALPLSEVRKITAKLDYSLTDLLMQVRYGSEPTNAEKK